MTDDDVPIAHLRRCLAATTTERFARDWQAVTGGAVGERTLVALSGGADSSAALLLLAAAGQGDLHAATVNHGLRAEAAAEAAKAAALAQDHGVPHATLSAALPDRVGSTGNLSARARALRYRLLKEHAATIGARWIVTAHHADDQVETMMMRLGRGAGLRGLSGVRARQGAVVRPLLAWRRAELAEVVARCGVEAVDDPSNVDDRFDRARLRKRLAGLDWLDPVAASRSAGALAQAEEAIGWMMDRLAAERCTIAGEVVTVQADGLPAELRRRLVEKALTRVDADIVLRGEEVGRVVAQLESCLGGTLGTVRYAGDGQGFWTFRPAPPRRAH